MRHVVVVVVDNAYVSRPFNEAAEDVNWLVHSHSHWFKRSLFIINKRLTFVNDTLRNVLVNKHLYTDIVALVVGCCFRSVIARLETVRSLAIMKLSTLMFPKYCCLCIWSIIILGVCFSRYLLTPAVPVVLCLLNKEANYRVPLPPGDFVSAFQMCNLF